MEYDKQRERKLEKDKEEREEETRERGEQNTRARAVTDGAPDCPAQWEAM